MTFIDTLLGTDRSLTQYTVFFIFTLLGMILIKLISYRDAKSKNPELVFEWKYWIKDNYLDFIAAFIASFLTLRFLGFLLNYLDFSIPIITDEMVYGMILGLSYQFTFRQLLKWANRDK